MKVEGLTYWECKVGWFAGRHLSREQLAWIGAIDLFAADRPWRTDRGWRSAEVLRSASLDQEREAREAREAQVRGIRYLVDLGTATGELSV